MKNILTAMTAVLFSLQGFAKAPDYQVNLRIGMKGQQPMSINTPMRSGKKTFFSEISDDGQSETLVELYAKKAKENEKDGLLMDVMVTKTVKGQKKYSERTQFFAIENQEIESGSTHGRSRSPLSVAVMAHQL